MANRTTRAHPGIGRDGRNNRLIFRAIARCRRFCDFLGEFDHLFSLALGRSGAGDVDNRIDLFGAIRVDIEIASAVVRNRRHRNFHFLERLVGDRAVEVGDKRAAVGGRGWPCQGEAGGERA